MTDLFDPNNRYVNGPINVVRLEGRVNGVKKTIYVFFDFHEDISLQKKCASYKSVDIDKFFARNFFELSDQDTIYDFIFEIKPSMITSTNKNSVGQKYVFELLKFFARFFEFDTRLNKVYMSKILKNIRFHYLDLRDSFDTSLIMVFYDTIVNNGIKLVKKPFLEFLISKFTLLLNYVKILRNIIDSTPSEIIKQNLVADSKYFDQIRIAYIINKIKNKYNDNTVKTILNDQIKIICKRLDAEINLIVSIIDDSRNAIKLLEDKTLSKNKYVYEYRIPVDNIRKIKYDLEDKIENLIYTDIKIRQMLTDVYALRRFLDKSYIQHAISYTGGQHSIYYIYILTKFFNFKITHAANTNGHPIKELNNLVKQHDDFIDLSQYFYPTNFVQCSNLDGFPDKFL